MRSYLLDTHTLLWMQDDNKTLSTTAREILEDSRCNLYLSIASFWEISIKQSLGKLQLEYTLDELSESCLSNNILVLPIQLSALNILKNLPFIHRDPFDRIIVSTAIDMNFNLITKDLNLHRYDANIVW
ncbi:type II toxin-antitoxin system VapC family toxin [Pedobacter sp. CFBP9032]|uniref:type II toxin-antitoxin system VapC family toxin n=1 Tax=Pedobacter sp. CFBP9032 TaxID=3096539 RepID=UPI002A6AA32E|nr:type II toxin-antitoxin system VapC family toxin [Pedobacter sp. CFBP9032]MDY0903716.1 type II toxin-antitoxin system VapC family toxin [Pedobacter sp. CFBP9032]